MIAVKQMSYLVRVARRNKVHGDQLFLEIMQKKKFMKEQIEKRKFKKCKKLLDREEVVNV